MSVLVLFLLCFPLMSSQTLNQSETLNKERHNETQRGKRYNDSLTRDMTMVSTSALVTMGHPRVSLMGDVGVINDETQ